MEIMQLCMWDGAVLKENETKEHLEALDYKVLLPFGQTHYSTLRAGPQSAIKSKDYFPNNPFHFTHSTHKSLPYK